MVIIQPHRNREMRTRENLNIIYSQGTRSCGLVAPKGTHEIIKSLASHIVLLLVHQSEKYLKSLFLWALNRWHPSKIQPGRQETLFLYVSYWTLF